MIDEGDYWIAHLKKNNKKDLAAISLHYPLESVINIDTSKILDNKVYARMIDVPKGEIEIIIDAAKIAGNFDDKIKPIIRFINIKRKILIKNIKPDADEKKLRSIVCLVKRSSAIQSKILSATYKCRDDHFTTIKPKHEQVQGPKYCSAYGCKQRTFEHIEERDTTINRQYVYVQDPLESLGDGDVQPKSIRCEVFKDLCNTLSTGERVILNGYYRTVPKIKDGVLQAGKDGYFEVNSIERGESVYSDIKWTDEEEVQIKEMAAKPNVFDLVTDSIAPSIMGMRLFKQAIVLLLFGGVTKTMPDGTRRRGHINILCVSDPGMAKTVILKFVEQISPRGVYASGVTSSKVGLVAPIVRDETTGAYTIEPGPYMLANGGVFCLDEANEISKDDAKYIGECMENGECHITKAVNVIVKTEAPLLAACNPDDGIYNPKLGLAKQVSLPDAILSRFDIKIILTDDAGKDRDRALAKHIGRTLRAEYKNHDGVILPHLLRKYIAYARNINPKLTDDVDTILGDYYEQVRIESRSDSHMAVTSRQLLSLYHMAEAHARLHLRDQVLAEDAKAALTLFDLAFRNVNTDQQGRLDPSMSDVKGKKEWLGRTIVNTILEIGGSTKKCSEMSLVSAMKKKNVEENRVMDALRILKHEGTLLEPTTGLLQVI
jgi:replicative DNA helicase Mcm